MWIAILQACTSPQPVSPTQPGPDDGLDSVPPDPSSCGRGAPVIQAFDITDASDPTHGGTLHLSLSITDADGDLAPSTEVGLFWDTVVDGTLAHDSPGVSFTVEEPDAPRCTTFDLAVDRPIPIDQIDDLLDEPFPRDACVEFQVSVRGHDQLYFPSPAQESGFSEVIVRATPRADGSPSTLSCGEDSSTGDTGSTP